MLNLQIKDLAAVDGINGGNVKRNFLGHLCWYTIYDVKVTRDEMIKKFAEAGMPAKYLPNPISAVDAFRRATAELEENRLPSHDKFVNYLVREVVCDKNVVIRHLIKEVVDAKNVRLEYSKVAEIIFRREDESIKIIDYGANGKVANLESLYKEYRNSYNGQHIRRIVRTVLADMNPAAARPSGGVYFIPLQYEEGLFALEKLVKLLQGEFFTMPVIDQEKSRDMLYQKFKEQIRENIKQMADILKAGASKNETVKIINESKKMFEQIREYEELLNRDLNDLKTEVEILKDQIVSLRSINMI
ncbi:hypothetical protein AN618_18880 [Fervidicola ferrireducens]|uniref:Uncharacterized protein n=1 Tax=Fervidicola ferrireducens TaxID=520764 RepID=A0A140L4P0_9FIRM|nr:DUF6744 family protein [Fervidicola ferrireducens]KXG75515.1 hypothetical protein AN618_18880 [Fervidicola ferrireducens]